MNYYSRTFDEIICEARDICAGLNDSDMAAVQYAELEAAFYSAQTAKLHWKAQDVLKKIDGWIIANRHRVPLTA